MLVTVMVKHPPEDAMGDAKLALPAADAVRERSLFAAPLQLAATRAPRTGLPLALSTVTTAVAERPRRLVLRAMLMT